AGGNPGGWLHCPSNGSNPEWYGPNNAPGLSGDFRARGVTQITCDMRQDSLFNTLTCWLVLVRDPDPNVSSDETRVALLADGNLSSPPGGAGWVSYSFSFDPASTTLPAPGISFGGPPNGDARWNEVIEDVTRIEFHWANNPFLGFDLLVPPPGWNFGLDNVGYTELSLVSPFCFGDGGDGMGCTDCPCGNNAMAGSGGGCLNSNAQSAVLSASGSTSLSAADLCLGMTGGSSSTFAILTSGASRAPANAANPCFGLDSGIVSPVFDGLRCVVSGVLRHGTRPLDPAGVTSANPWGNCSASFPNASFAIGETRHFQAVYREQAGAVCATGQNTTQGLSVTFAP
ncbi:MAG: hypothetical protein AAF368_18510, partial [Planctomycetota bacterium]